MSILNNTKALIAAGAGAGIALFSAGSVAGYFYAKKKLVAQYDEMLKKEVVATREFYKKRNKVGEFETPEAAAQHLGLEVAAGEALASYTAESTEIPDEVLTHRDRPVVNYNGVSADPVTGEIYGAIDASEPAQTIRNNVFANPPTTGVDFAYEQEIAARSKDRPYIISEEEWNDNDPSHEQVEMTYYEGDGILADPNDKPVALVDETVGRDNLRFGHRSNDDNVVYVRHETYTLDMMVVRDERSYGEVVGGFVQGTGPR